MTMLIPINIPKWLAVILYPAVCGLFGLLFGTLYAPAQALLYSYDLKTTIKWIMVGLPYDVIHAVGNVALGILVYPLSNVIKKLK